MKAKMKTKISFIGGGNMAEALISGLVGSGLIDKKAVTVTDVRKERLAFLKKKYGVSTAADNAAAVKAGNVVFFCIKPQQMEEVLTVIGPVFKKGQLIISIAAGITTRYIEKFVPKGVAVVRAMPNTPALISAAAIAVARGKYASKTDSATAQKLFSSAGTVVELKEDKINAVTALSGSGPAYVFYLAEILTEAGVAAGLQKAVAEALARQTIFGSGKMLAGLDTPAEQLRRNVTSPGGTTAAAISVLESEGTAGIFKKAVLAARKRAEELAK